MAIYSAISWLLLLPLIAVLQFKVARETRRAAVFIWIGCAFAVLYVAAPSVLFLTAPGDYSLLKFSWMRDLSSDPIVYGEAACLVAISLLCLYVGYSALTPKVAPAASCADPSSTPFLIAGVALTLIGLAGFVTFLYIVGGPAVAFGRAWALRSGTPDDLPLAKWAFVKRLSFFALPGSVFLLQAASRRVALWALAIISVMVSLVIVTFMVGRLTMVLYVGPLLLGLYTFRGRLTGQVVVLSICWAALIFATIVGTRSMIQATHSFAFGGAGALAPEAKPQVQPALPPPPPPPSATTVSQAPTPSGSAVAPPAPARPYYLPQQVTAVGLEFAFPFVNLLSVVNDPPRWRWFADLVLPFAHLVPKRMVPIGDLLPPRLWEVNTARQVGAVPWGIPVDLIAFGFFSMGVIGVAFCSFGFGFASRWVEQVLPAPDLYGDAVFRYSWIMLLPALVMYGDPNWLVVEQLHWIVALMIVIAIRCRYRTPDLQT